MLPRHVADEDEELDQLAQDAFKDDGDPLNDPPERRARIADEKSRAANIKPSEDAEPADGPTTRPKAKPRFPFVDSAAFASGDFRPQWLISRMLVKSQPGVIAGPSKALKTNLSIDLAVSLASGRRFLGQFAVPKRARVAVVSGESGEHTLQETANRICKAKGLNLANLNGHLDWCFNLPTFSDLGTMTEFADTLASLNAEVVIIDPVYLALGNIDAKCSAAIRTPL